VLVNNTGGPPHGPILEARAEDFASAFGRHVLAAHLLVRRLLPGMAAAGYGRIVNVVSISVREPIPGLGVSNTIRGAMASWAKSVSHELPPGVTINNVLPGYTDTERLAELAASISAASGRSVEDVRAEWAALAPEKRLGRPEEIGAAVAWLASPAASFVRGVSLPVDGGRLRAL
jgi:3-oxoacyl-[acyl-carrier protein] reductase